MVYDMESALSAIKQIMATGGKNAKAAIVEENKENIAFRGLLIYALDPLKTYHLSEKTLAEPLEKKSTIYNAYNICDVCRLLDSKSGVDSATISDVRAFLADYDEDTREIYRKILAKTLRLGITAKTVNKVIPGLISEWEVQQAYPIEKYPVKDGEWFALTQKLNGVRATYYNGQLIARSGEPFTGLEHITDHLASLGFDLVFDGELTLRDKGELSDNEAFRTATGIINSDGDKTSICYTIFDVLPTKDFENGSSEWVYNLRRATLDTHKEVLEKCESVSVLPVLYSGVDQSKIWEFLDQMVAEDKEGLMVNLNVPYQCKRHKGVLKVKRFYTMDLPIIGVEQGSGRLSGTLGALVLNYKGNEVRVGSGFTDEQRRWFWGNGDNVIGSLCEVKYKEISSDKKTGAESLQFPVYVSLRTDKEDVSFG